MKNIIKRNFYSCATLDAVPGEDQIRVVPSLRGKSGGVWSKYAFPHSDWEVVVTFRVQGKGRIGADGLVRC